MAEQKYLVDIDMNGQRIKNVLLDGVDAVPEDASTVAGRILYLTTDNAIYYSDGTEYQQIASVTAVNAIVAEIRTEIETELEGYIPTTEKGVADGVATLDENAQVPVAQLPTGNESNRLVLLSGTIETGAVIQYDGTGFTSRSLATVYTPRGSVETYEELPSDAQAGDVYNVNQAYGDYPAGTNYAYTSDGEWDALGGWIDLSVYQTVSNLATSLDSPSDTTYPSTQAVATALEGKVDALETGPTAGTYTKVTIDASGLVTAGDALVASDIPDISATYVTQTQIGVGEGLIPTVAGTASAGQLIAVNETADGFEFVDIDDIATEGAEYDIVGDDATTEFTFDHSFGAVPRSVQVVDADGNDVGVGVQRTSTQIVITMNVAPATGTSYKVYVLG